MSTAVSIGMFDGVHQGHRALVDRARELVGPEGRVVVVTFEPSPAAILAPGREPARLTMASQRTEALQAAGVDHVHVLDTTTDLLAMDARSFIDDLCRQHQPDHIVEGPDFRFGHQRGGDLDRLREIGRDQGFGVHVVEVVETTLLDRSVVPVRSSVIRRLLDRGRVRDANVMIGRPWQVRGTVESGHKRGRELGWPTANLETADLLLPADGVYAGVGLMEDGTRWPAAVSVGTNPTFGDGRRSCEVHLLEFNGPVDSYGWTLSVELHHWLREQLVFDSIEALKRAIGHDLDRVRELVAR
ncbi:MAG: riboflavin biosynthesis protein RibF [Phycisphaerales bacterium]|nr:riboflavin biosynthesis protein RibF [Phycisphaerales bacterium]